MTPGWPSGNDHVAYDKLPELLWRGSAQHARVVYELYPGEDGWDAQRLAISIGTAVELLLKHALALQSFHLLPDKFAPETALTLDGKGTPVSHLPQMATVAGTPLVERANKLWDLKWGKEDFDLVFRVRNTALHLGVASTQANKDAVEKMVLLTDRLFTHLGTDTAAQVVAAMPKDPKPGDSLPMLPAPPVVPVIEDSAGYLVDSRVKCKSQDSKWERYRFVPALGTCVPFATDGTGFKIRGDLAGGVR